MVRKADGLAERTISRAPESVDTQIDYLVPTSRINRRFWAPGAELNTGAYAPYPVTIRNARLAAEPFTLDRHGFCLAQPRHRGHRLARRGAGRAIYPAEVDAGRMRADRRRHRGADGRHGPLVRQDRAGRAAAGGGGACGFHGAAPPNKLADAALRAGRAGRARLRRFIAFSLWRAISPPPQSWPLALCDGSSVGDEEGTRNTKVDVDVAARGRGSLEARSGRGGHGGRDHLPPQSRRTAGIISRTWSRTRSIFIKFHD